VLWELAEKLLEKIEWWREFFGTEGWVNGTFDVLLSVFAHALSKAILPHVTNTFRLAAVGSFVLSNALVALLK
jgi:hypothetical protein